MWHEKLGSVVSYNQSLGLERFSPNFKVPAPVYEAGDRGADFKQEKVSFFHRAIRFLFLETRVHDLLLSGQNPAHRTIPYLEARRLGSPAAGRPQEM